MLLFLISIFGGDNMSKEPHYQYIGLGLVFILVVSFLEYCYRKDEMKDLETYTIMKGAELLAESMLPDPIQIQNILEQNEQIMIPVMQGMDSIDQNTKIYVIFHSDDTEVTTAKKMLLSTREVFYGMNLSSFRKWLYYHENELIDEIMEKKPEFCSATTHLEIISFQNREIDIEIKQDLTDKYENKTGFHFFIQTQDERIVVYNHDENDAWLFDTDLKCKMLPDELQMQLKEGILLRDEEALYNFLESYSS